MFTPYRRKKPESMNSQQDLAETEKAPEDKNVTTERDGSNSERSAAESVPEETPDPERSWYNSVLYGLPNLVITQLS